MDQHSDKPNRACGSSMVDIRDYFTLWLTKLEAFYNERDQANKESVKAAFNAAAKASEKNEAAFAEYKTGANEWRDTVKDLIAGLKEASAIGVRRDIRGRETRSWLVPVIAIGVVAVINLVVTLLK